MSTGSLISLGAPPILSIGPVPVTNSMILGAAGTAILLGVLFHARNRSRTGRHTRLSIAVLWMFEILLNTTEDVLGNRAWARQVAPLAITLFCFILINNWLEILPIVGPITWHGHQLFRGLAADMNATFGLAIISFVSAQLWAIRRRGLLGNLRRYIANPLFHPLQAYLGLLEIIAEFSRTAALSMRLFGNIFGGEVLLIVVTAVASWAAPVALPLFMFLELFVGAVQAYIFFMLTVTFISLGSPESAQRAPATVPVRESVRPKLLTLARST